MTDILFSSSEERRKKLLNEQKNDLKQFLAQQASITHPRLYKLSKRKEIPPVNINEAYVKDSYPTNRSPQHRLEPLIQPSRDKPTSFEPPQPPQNRLPEQPPYSYPMPTYPSVPPLVQSVYNPYLMPGNYSYPYEMYRHPIGFNAFQNYQYQQPIPPPQQPVPPPTHHYQDPRLERYRDYNRTPVQPSPSPKLSNFGLNDKYSKEPNKDQKNTQQLSDYPFANSRSPQRQPQSKTEYAQELQRQIQAKQLQKLKEKEASKQDEWVFGGKSIRNHDPKSTISRKQFPDEITKLYNSTAFPESPARSSLNHYSTLPPISSTDNTENLTGFPPVDRSFIRGALHEVPDWQHQDLEQKRQQQKQIQDALKQQIAEKEQLKQKLKMEQRLDDEKEQQRVLKEQQELYERYAREKEEQRKKEEQELLEKQAKLEKQKLEQEKEEENYKRITSKSAQKRIQVQRAPSPPQVEPTPTVPFRSNSPPLPAVLKKMKEQGYEPPVQNETIREPDPPQPSFDDTPIKRNISTAPFQESITPKTPLPPPDQPKVQSVTPKIHIGQKDTIEILEQLAQIQKAFELENENIQVQNELKQTEEMLKADQGHFEQFKIDNDLHTKSARPKSGHVFSTQEPTVTRATLSARYRKYKEASSEKRQMTPKPPKPSQSKSTTQDQKYIPLQELTDTESQILSISQALMASRDIATPEQFNIDEIERKNDKRLRMLEMSAQEQSSSDVLAQFMAQTDQNKSIPTSPSTYQPLLFHEL